MRFVRTAENLFGLPQGFTRVEYLQSSGTQYIDTGYVPTTKNNFVIDFSLNALNSNCCPFGCATGSLYTEVFLVTAPNASTISQVVAINNNTVYNRPSFPWATNVNYHTELTQTNLIINGNVVDTFTVGSGTASQTICLFARNNSGTVDFKGNMKICSFKAYDNGVLVRDFIPCIDPLGVSCMYDLVGKKPYYNQGTGTFTTGRKIIPVEYVESTGTQYVDTGYNPNSNTRVETRFKMNETPNNFVWFFHARNQTVAGDGYGFGCNGSGYITSDFNNRVSSSTVKLTSGTIYNIVKDKNICKVNDITLTNTNSTFTINYSLLIFALNDHDSVNASIPKANCYYFRIYDNDVLVRDFIPCKDENNVGFMFDTLSGTVYLNAGTGAFGVGENKYTSKLRLIKEARELPDGYKRVEYLESVGGQLIDTGYNINTATDEVETYFQLITTDKYKWLMGEHDNGARFGIGSGDGTNLRNIAYGATTYKVNDVQVYNNRHVFTAKSNGVYLDGVQVHGFESFTSTSTVYLFNLNISGGGNGAAGKIWSYKHKRNGVLIRDFVPCLDKNNVPCMVDLVSGGTYYNQGTGSFSYGHIITPVEYLEGTGTQYIDTGYIPNNNSEIEIVCNSGGVQGTNLFGYRNASASSKNITITTSSTGTTVFYTLDFNNSNYNTYRYNYESNANQILKIKISKSERAIYNTSGTLLGGNSTSCPDVFTCDSTAYLMNVAGTPFFTQCFKGKVYGCKIWDNGTLARSFIPVRDENNAGYMFDEVTGQLFGNIGSGSFGIGNDLPKPKVRFIQDVIPSAYLPLKYLESTGTQYIDTGVVGKTGISTRIKASTTTLSDNNLIGSTLGVSGNYTRFFITYFSNKMRIGYGGYSDSSSVSSGVIYDFLYKTNNTYQKLYINGVESYTGSSTTNINTGLSMYLFGRHSVVNGSELENKYLMSGKIYYCQIWDNGVPVLDLYPVLRKSDNKPGMYDRITKQFFVNQGTGEFNYG